MSRKLVRELRVPRTAALLAAVLAACWTSEGSGATATRLDVTTSAESFDPTKGQKISVRFSAPEAGTATVTIVDRDGFPIRKLAPVRVESGPVSIEWNGRDDRDTVVPDEAYVPRIRFVAGPREVVFDPLQGFMPEAESVPQPTYSPLTASLSYVLSKPSRVHVQAGQAQLDPATGQTIGPVLSTLVDRKPRISGTVVEPWNGFDGTGRIQISQLPHMVVSVFATSLPQASLLTVGNTSESFVRYAARRRPAAAKAVRKGRAEESGHAHHAGLTVFEDATPAVRVIVGKRPVDSVVALKGRPLPRLSARLQGDHLPHFLAQPATAFVFLDGALVQKIERPRHPLDLKLPEIPSGDHVLAVNWSSHYGPTAVGAIPIRKP